jgi:Ca2+-binding EF-hand superfamily protein
MNVIVGKFLDMMRNIKKRNKGKVTVSKFLDMMKNLTKKDMER